MTENALADPLSDVLKAVRLTGSLFFVVEERSPYAAAAPSSEDLAPAILPGAQRIVSYHVVREGGCWFSLPPGGESSRLEAGDILVVPHGDPYELSDPRGERSCLPLAASVELFRRLAARELPPVVGTAGDGPPLRLICGFLGCDIFPFNPAIAALPRALVVHPAREGGSDRSDRSDRLDTLVNLLATEASAPSAGSDGVLLRLGELLFVEVIRRHLESLTGGDRGWLAGLRDPLVGRALALLHARPAEPWTLYQLARESGVSRSNLAARFTRLVGKPPMQYLTHWRIQLAARWLADGQEKVAAVGHRVGYDSEAAFSRSFKKAVGVSPDSWRKSRAALPSRG